VLTLQTADTPTGENGNSVSEVLDAAVRPVLAACLEPVLKAPPSFGVSVSRTDAGVHARHNIVTFNVKVQGPPPSDARGESAGFPLLDMIDLTKTVNENLPRDIRVHRFFWAPTLQYPAQSLCGKRYVYTAVLVSKHPGGADDGGGCSGRHVWEIGGYSGLDVAAMRRAAKTLTGTHDFAMLATHKPPRKHRGAVRYPIEDGAKRTSVRTVTSLTVETPDSLCVETLVGGCCLRSAAVPTVEACPGCNQQCSHAEMIVTISVEGDGFLRHQVRRMASLLIDIGLARLPPDTAARLLGGDGTKPSRAPAKGLCLWQIFLKDL
jgi:tRNA pseudouridine(38-40) synthase